MKPEQCFRKSSPAGYQKYSWFPKRLLILYLSPAHHHQPWQVLPLAFIPSHHGQLAWCRAVQCWGLSWQEGRRGLAKAAFFNHEVVFSSREGLCWKNSHPELLRVMNSNLLNSGTLRLYGFQHEDQFIKWKEKDLVKNTKDIFLF